MISSIQMAGIIGPILMILAISEYFHFSIWKQVSPAIVHLNGFVLFVMGLIAVRNHNIWIIDWTLTITIISWLCLSLGALRMLFPGMKQAEDNWFSKLILLVLFLIGSFLTIKGYF